MFGFLGERNSMTAFPYDDPVWDEAPHCYGVGANVLLEELEKELAAAKLKLAGLETLIDVAEQELHIDIRKKSDTKQSK